MPVGILIDTAAIIIGCFLGNVLKKHFPVDLANALNMTCASMCLVLGVSLIVQYSQLSAVALAAMLGVTAGELLGINRGIDKLTGKLSGMFDGKQLFENIDTVAFASLIIIFSAGGYGLFNSLNEGITGAHGPLIAKAILDFFTIMCFSVTFGKAMYFMCVPQLVIYLTLFLIGKLIGPSIDPVVLSDMKACAGIITINAGLNLLFKKNIPSLNMLPALLFIIPLSLLWMSIF